MFNVFLKINGDVRLYSALLIAELRFLKKKKKEKVLKEIKPQPGIKK